MIVPSREVAELLKTEWVNQWTPKEKNVDPLKFLEPKNQHIRKVRNMQHDLVETIKYGSKVFSEPDPINKSRKKKDYMIYARALDNIIVAMKGLRLFDRFGFNLPSQPKVAGRVRTVEHAEEYIFFKEDNDWVNSETGECLTGYTASAELQHLLSEGIDDELQ